MTKTFNWFGYLLIGALVTLTSEAKAESLHDASRDGDIERVRALIDAGSDLDEQGDNGQTALNTAILEGHASVAVLLIDRGADVGAKNEGGFTALHAAAYVNAFEVAELLLDRGANPDGGAGSTPLYLASQKGHLEVIELLLAKEADPTIATADGITPLHEAAVIGHLEISQTLVAHGADVNALTDSGEPPIHFAVLHRHADVAAYLIEMGAAAGEIAPITELLASADLAEGESEVKACTGCHRLEKGKSYYGPSLWNVVGRAKGSVSDFAYSQSFSMLDGDWTFDTLNEFLARPTEVIPGNTMKFRGMGNPQKRANLIAFLRTLSDNPVPLPTP